MIKVSFLTIIVAIATTILSLSSNIFFFEWDRDLILKGEVWRLFTGHLLHFGASHLVWDLGTFLVFGFFIENKVGARKYSLFLFFSTLFISLFILIFVPQIKIYRGLSGLCVMLYTLSFIKLLKSDDKVIRNFALVSLIGLVLKIGFEGFTGQTLFASGVSPLWQAHLAGAICGVFLARDWGGNKFLLR